MRRPTRRIQYQQAILAASGFKGEIHVHARVATYELVSGEFDELANRTAAELGAILA